MLTIISAILYRTDGWGRGDTFLPFWPFNKIPKWGGVNYTRYAIGPVIALYTQNMAYLLTYTIAVSVPYGEDSFIEKYFGPFKWLIIGMLFGGASMSPGMALWCGMISLITKHMDIDHSVWEFFVMGFFGTIWVWFI